MAEFKISKQLSSEIASLRDSGSALNDDFCATDAANVNTLKTAYEFIKEQTRIKNLLVLYASLLAKDAKDLDDMVAAAEAADTAASGTYKA